MNTTPSRLGRGLGSLLGEDGLDTPAMGGGFMLAVERIEANKDQPRKSFDEEKLLELAESLRQKGMIQPVVVRRQKDGNYQIIAGERRWRAAKMAGLKEIPVIEKDYNDAETLEISLLENIQREDLNPVEQARAFEKLVNDYGYSHKQVGMAVGKSRMAVSNIIRLLKLPAAIITALEKGKISYGHARALLAKAEDEDFLTEVVENIVRENLSVREIEKMMAGPAEIPPHQTPPPVTERPRKAQESTEMEKTLSSLFQARVTISENGGRGKIILEYDNAEEYLRLVGVLQNNGSVE